VRHRTLLGIAFTILFCPAGFAQPTGDSSLPRVIANDNRTSAGQLKNGVLNLRLELRLGAWYPEDESGGHRDVYAFAEEGHAPQSSGPLIRVPQGTKIHISIRNALPLAAKIFGLHRHPGDAKDAVILAAGETHESEFFAGEPGTYLYWATTSNKPLELRDEAETLLSGAFIVDPPGIAPNDRIFVIGVWTKGVESDETDEIPSINGKSWPFSEHLTYDIGESVHWRILNPTFSQHAMHLHGFYYMVEGMGDGERYVPYVAEQHRQVVTQLINPGQVMQMTWMPERPGNWLFHCHMVAHMSPPEPLHPPQPMLASHSAAPEHSAGMGGLVLGITVRARNTPVAREVAVISPRKIQLVISDNAAKTPLYSLEVIDPSVPAQPDANKPARLLGPPIVLTRGEFSEIEIKNQTSHPTSIHWHGIELDSFFDGVAGWTGSGEKTSPPVAPGTSFFARMTPPRAGTFIYHTHWHDGTQLLNGVYGPLIVLEPDTKYDPETDKTFLFSLGKYDPFGLILLVNGTPEPYPLKLRAGIGYRLRFINITENEVDLRVRLTSEDIHLKWKVVAKDGAGLPPAQLQSTSAELAITVGETYDVEYWADGPGNAELQAWTPGFPVRVTQPLKFVAPK
jgi:manganese oxidase